MSKKVESKHKHKKEAVTATKTRVHLSDKDKERMMKAYKKGMKLAEITEEFGVSSGQAWIVCTEAGQKWRKQGGKSDRKLASEKAEKRGKGKSDKGKSGNKKMSALAALKDKGGKKAGKK